MCEQVGSWDQSIIAVRHWCEVISVLHYHCRSSDLFFKVVLSSVNLHLTFCRSTYLILCLLFLDYYLLHELFFPAINVSVISNITHILIYNISVFFEIISFFKKAIFQENHSSKNMFGLTLNVINQLYKRISRKKLCSDLNFYIWKHIFPIA